MSLSIISLASLASDILLVSFASDAKKDVTHQWSAMNDPVMGGQSTSRVAVEGNVLNFTGTCAIVPALKAPGFITAVTGNRQGVPENFVDVSSCTGLSVLAQADSDYKGFRISFGTAHPAGGFRYSSGYKADLHPTVGQFGPVQIPFNGFTDFWDGATGDPIHTCAENSTYCPDTQTLTNMKTMSIWAEGYEGDIHRTKLVTQPPSHSVHPDAAS
jgi:hypothetical protein